MTLPEASRYTRTWGQHIISYRLVILQQSKLFKTLSTYNLIHFRRKMIPSPEIFSPHTTFLTSCGTQLRKC